MKHPIEYLKAEANKFSTIEDFKRKKYLLYRAARRRGLLPSITKHMADYGRYKNNLTGKRSGSFTILNYVGASYWLCKCDCGNEVEIRSDALGPKRSGHKCLKICPYRSRTRSTKAPGEAGMILMFRNYKAGAKSRGLEWGLTIDEFKVITSGNCVYCGIEPHRIVSVASAGKKIFERVSKEYIDNSKYKFNGADRVDNNKGYVFSNCVSCCFKCNVAKNKLSKDEFLDHIKRIYNFSFKERNFGC